MDVNNAVFPVPGQMESFFDVAEDGPFVMVNLVKFKDRATYDDDPSIDISGREAYERYATAMHEVLGDRGGKIIFHGDVTGLLLGEVAELWDAVALVEYVSHAAFLEQMGSPERAAIERHRSAGLAGQLNLRVTPSTH
jgi:uncharacterized protein (DUF1330 family)